MKRLFFRCSDSISFYLIALLWVSCDMIMDAGKIGGRELLAVVLRPTLWLVLLPLTIRLVDRATRDCHYIVDAGITVCFSIVSMVVSDCVFVAIISRVGPPQYMYITPRTDFLRTLRPALRFYYPMILLIVSVVTVMRWTEARRREQAEHARASDLEARTAEARLQLLRAQIHPHFLFNSLNSVLALVRNEPERARAMLERLATFYSRTTEDDRHSVVPLHKELALAREYLEIEQIRFGPRLVVSLHLDPQVADAEVPLLLLQPLVENAVKHGVAHSRGSSEIRITASQLPGAIQISIENRGPSERVAYRRGVGLANTATRLRQTYGDATEIEILRTDGAFEVRLRIPRQTASANRKAVA